jgi:translation initiation factor IF-2
VQNGSLEVGDVVVAGTALGKLKAMFDFRGKMIHKANPSTPVAVMGLNEVPQAGEVFRIVSSEKEARIIVNERQLLASEPSIAEKVRSPWKLLDRWQLEELRLIVSRRQGSLEPIVSSLESRRR